MCEYHFNLCLALLDVVSGVRSSSVAVRAQPVLYVHAEMSFNVIMFPLNCQNGQRLLNRDSLLATQLCGWELNYNVCQQQ